LFFFRRPSGKKTRPVRDSGRCAGQTTDFFSLAPDIVSQANLNRWVCPAKWFCDGKIFPITKPQSSLFFAFSDFFATPAGIYLWDVAKKKYTHGFIAKALRFVV
jgi:hypothetical protein